MGRFLLFWGMQPAARIICPPWRANSTLAGREVFFLTHVSSEKTIKIICRLRAANAAGRAGLFAAVRQMRHDKSLWKAPRALGHGAFLIF